MDSWPTVPLVVRCFTCGKRHTPPMCPPPPAPMSARATWIVAAAVYVVLCIGCYFGPVAQ